MMWLTGWSDFRFRHGEKVYVFTVASRSRKISSCLGQAFSHWSNGLVVMISVLHCKEHRRSPVRSWIGPLFDFVLKTLDPVLVVPFPPFIFITL